MNLSLSPLSYTCSIPSSILSDRFGLSKWQCSISATLRLYDKADHSHNGAISGTDSICGLIKSHRRTLVFMTASFVAHVAVDCGGDQWCAVADVDVGVWLLVCGVDAERIELKMHKLAIAPCLFCRLSTKLVGMVLQKSEDDSLEAHQFGIREQCTVKIQSFKSED